MYRFSYLMTYRGTVESRRSNLHFILDQLCLDPTLEIILVEQDVTSQFESEKHSNLKHIFVENANHFNKSWGLNIAAGNASCERMVFADSDMLISATALDAIYEEMNKGVDAVNPYDILVDLNQQESQQLLTQKNAVDISRTSEQINRKSIGQHPPFCGGVFAITRGLYDLTGGMDERFEGWGGDDDAMSKRIDFFASKVSVLNDVAYHLWHEPYGDISNASESYVRNLALLSMYYERQQSLYQSLARKDADRNADPSKYRSNSVSSVPNNQNQLISCLCVTRGRVPLLARAIDCFQKQTYLHKELVVLCEEDDGETIDFLSELDVEAVRYHIVPIEPKLSLGDLRNLSINMAKGEFVCQWDDDDWYHPERLAKQLDSALRQNKAASILPRWLIYQCKNKTVFCSNIRLWEGSLLCRKSALPTNEAYDKKCLGEDSSLIEMLFIEDQLAIEDFPDLYVYCLSGENTWDAAHFKQIIESSVMLNEEDAAIVKKRIGI